MFRILISFLLVGILRAQAPPPKPTDPLGRTSPQESIVHFLEACHAHEYAKAMLYLDLRKIPQPQRNQQGPELARQLEDLLDDTSFELTSLSRDPEGDQNDGLATANDRLATFNVEGKTVELQLERVELKAGTRVWLVSPDSVALIPEAHKLVGETPFEKRLPQSLVTFEILDTPIWRWIALILAAAALWIASGIVATILARALKRLTIV